MNLLKVDNIIPEDMQKLHTKKPPLRICGARAF